MSISNELSDLNDNIIDAYDSINTKGGTVPQNKNTANLASAIASIPQSGGGGNDYDIPMEVTRNGTFQRKTDSFNYKLPNDATNLESHSLTYAFWNAGVAKIDFNNITTISTGACEEMCYRCFNLTEVKFTKVATIEAYGLSKAFVFCSNLGDIYFPALQNNFDGYTSQFDNMFQNTSNKTAHFPIQLKPTMSSWTSVNNGFGSSTGQALFDLHATELDFTITPATRDLYVNGELMLPNQQILVDPYTSNNYLITDPNIPKVVYAELTNLTEETTEYITVDLNTITTNRISISTGVTGLTGSMILSGQLIPLTETSTGVYSIDINVASGVSLSYTINGGRNYNDASGTITTTGSDLTVPVTLTPATTTTFVRPDLTADGTMGGSAFAVSSDPVPTSTYAAYKAVDSSATSRWRVNAHPTNYYYFYNPNPLCVNSLTFTWYSTTASYQAGAITVYGSNDNSTWVQLSYTPKPAAADNPATRTITVNSQSFYKYHRLDMDTYGTSGAVDVKNLAIDALEKV